MTFDKDLAMKRFKENIVTQDRLINYAKGHEKDRVVIKLPEPSSLLTDVEIRIFAKSIYQIDRLPTIVETAKLSHILIDHVSDTEVEAFIRKSDDLLDKWNLEKKNGRII